MYVVANLLILPASKFFGWFLEVYQKMKWEYYPADSYDPSNLHEVIPRSFDLPIGIVALAIFFLICYSILFYFYRDRHFNFLLHLRSSVLYYLILFTILIGWYFEWLTELPGVLIIIWGLHMTIIPIVTNMLAVFMFWFIYNKNLRITDQNSKITKI